MKHKSKASKNNLPLLLNAISLSARAHEGQYRKDRKTPYAAHVFRVCLTLRHVFGIEDEKILAAAVLHDVIEDTDKDFDDIEERFGCDVAKWVALMSKDKRLPEDECEAAYAKQLANAPDEVKLIKLADIHDNLLDASSAESSQLTKTVRKTGRYLEAIKRKSSPKLKNAIRIVDHLRSQVK